MPKHARRSRGWQSIGIPLSREQIEQAGIRVHLSEGPQAVRPGATLTGEVPREPQYVSATPHLFVQDSEGRRVDPFRDDQALVLRTEGGPVVVSGCAHAGIINFCRAAQKLTGEERLRAVVGGFHLVGASAELLESTLAAFRDLQPQAIHPCHCTGPPAMDALAAAFPRRCRPIAAGDRKDFTA